MDCYQCDHDYIRTEIPFVNYVRDRKEADIHLLITTQRTGAGGMEYTMAFIGLQDFIEIQDTLKYVSQSTDTRDDVRKGMVRVIKLGLIPFINKTPIADYITVLCEEKVQPTAVEDKWNFWVFYIGFSGSVSGESQRRSFSLRGNLSASRVTPESKLRIGVSGNFNESKYTYEEETFSSYSDSKSFSTMYVKSLSEHWSIGAWFTAYSSTYNNIDLSLSPSPAIEYNLFPYSQSTRRQLRFVYRIGYSFRCYMEETIYDKTKENLLSESLSITFEVREPWGDASTTIVGSHYFHDLSNNRLQLYGHLSLRLTKGLSLSMGGGFSAIHDQLALRKGERTLDEILLRRSELATDFDYNASIGFSYTFGSVYSNVVNPRFGR
ncbi:MAG: hypothetical protein OEY25_12170 [Candidatus Aminicenantes bacterium]|nr:hypothetical protein [Candidatus Aminicenantes bacterium]